MRECGCEVEPVQMRNDNEEALNKVVEEVGRLRAANGGRGFAPDNTPVGASKSNGFIEGGSVGARAFEDMPEYAGREVGGNTRSRTQGLAVAFRVDWVADVEG